MSMQQSKISGGLPAPRRVKRDMGGGLMAPPWYERQEARGEQATGYVHLNTPGRTDVLPVSPAAGSYVIPADVVAGLGQDNSLAGADTIQKMLATGPYGMPLQRSMRGSGPPRPPPPYRAPGQQGGFSWGGGIGDMATRMPHVGAHMGSTMHIPSVPGMHSPITGLKSGGTSPREPKENIQLDDDGNVPVLIAGGEFVIPARMVQHHPMLGDGNLKKGHAVLDAWVLRERKKHIKDLIKLPPPKK